MTAHQAPPSLGFSRQEHWSGLPFPSPCFSLLHMPNKPSPVSFPNSSIIPNSSYSLTSFMATDHTPIPQRKKANPTITCHSLVLSNHSPTYLPFHKPSHPLTFCLSLTLLSIHLSLHPSIFPHVPFTHSSFHKFAYTLIFSSISPFSPPAIDHSLHLSPPPA